MYFIEIPSIILNLLVSFSVFISHFDVADGPRKTTLFLTKKYISRRISFSQNRHIIKVDYLGPCEIPKTKPEEVTKLEKEIWELRQKIIPRRRPLAGSYFWH